MLFRSHPPPHPPAAAATATVLPALSCLTQVPPDALDEGDQIHSAVGSEEGRGRCQFRSVVGFEEGRDRFRFVYEQKELLLYMSASCEITVNQSVSEFYTSFNKIRKPPPSLSPLLGGGSEEAIISSARASSIVGHERSIISRI